MDEEILGEVPEGLCCVDLCDCLPKWYEQLSEWEQNEIQYARSYVKDFDPAMGDNNCLVLIARLADLLDGV